MLVGLILKLHILDAFSLKDKRSSLRSIIERAQSRYKVTASELAQNDQIQYATIGFGLISNDRKVAIRILEKIMDKIEAHYEVEIIDYQWLEAETDIL